MNIPDKLQADNRARMLRIQGALCDQEQDQRSCSRICSECILDADLDVFAQWLKQVIAFEDR